jgi:hypothetical protein
MPEWMAPGPDDVRSPCPLLNTLANHNTIPHSGKNLTIPVLAAGFNKFVNVGSDVAMCKRILNFGLFPIWHVSGVGSFFL